MNFMTLFFNAMRMTNKIDCRRFAADPAYQQALQDELYGDTARHRAARGSAADTATAGTMWRTA